MKFFKDVWDAFTDVLTTVFTAEGLGVACAGLSIAVLLVSGAFGVICLLSLFSG